MRPSSKRPAVPRARMSVHELLALVRESRTGRSAPAPGERSRMVRAKETLPCSGRCAGLFQSARRRYSRALRQLAGRRRLQNSSAITLRMPCATDGRNRTQNNHDLQEVALPPRVRLPIAAAARPRAAEVSTAGRPSCGSSGRHRGPRATHGDGWSGTQLKRIEPFGQRLVLEVAVSPGRTGFTNFPPADPPRVPACGAPAPPRTTSHRAAIRRQNRRAGKCLRAAGARRRW